MAKRMVKVDGKEGVVLVWAFQELEELENRTGFVTCDESLGLKLLKSNKVQDPRSGAQALKHIEYGKPIQEVKVTKARPKATRQKVIEDTESK